MVRSIEGKHAGYYEAILQLRNVSEEIKEFAAKEIEQAGIYIAKTEVMKNGYDLYLGDSKFAKIIGTKLQHKFGGEYAVSPSLFSHKDGRNIYRLTILFRSAPFKKGDLVRYKGEDYTVKVVAKEIILLNLQTGKRKHLKYKEMVHIKV